MRSERGQSTVEFALSAPLLLLLLVGIFDVGSAVWQENTLSLAAREGARYAIVRGSLCASPCVQATAATVTTQVQNYAIGVPNVTVTVSWPSGTDVGDPVTVTASAPFTPFLSRYFLGNALRGTISGSTTMIIRQ